MSQIINGPQSQLDNTVRVFDQFYAFNMSVDANRYEIVLSYFLSVCSSRDTAKNFATMIFRIASIIDEDPLTLLGYMQGKEKIHTTALMTYYLNSIKSKTALYGINVTPSPNESIQRNIVI
jgi:hypothetical protein